jgi:hypothetical protein
MVNAEVRNNKFPDLSKNFIVNINSKEIILLIVLINVLTAGFWTEV